MKSTAANNKINTCEVTVSFLPGEKQLNEIELWLKTEGKDGFYANWSIIQKAFKEKHMAVVVYKDEAVGFVTWQIFDKYVATINIAEIKPLLRKKGLGKILVNGVLDFLSAGQVVVVDLHCQPASSERIWKSLGFIEFPDCIDFIEHNNPTGKKLYKILVPALPATKKQGEELLELWDIGIYNQANVDPKWRWVLSFKDNTRELSLPIIGPCHHEWKIRWSIDRTAVKDDSVKYFSDDIRYGDFLIIREISK